MIKLADPVLLSVDCVSGHRVPDVSPVIPLVWGADPHFLKLYFRYLCPAKRKSRIASAEDKYCQDQIREGKVIPDMIGRKKRLLN